MSPFVRESPDATQCAFWGSEQHVKHQPKAEKKRKGAEGVPTPEQVAAARVELGLTQMQAAALVRSPMRSWRAWEAPEGTGGHRYMHPGLWELFLIKTAAARAQKA